MTQPMEWAPALRNVLGAEGDVESARITAPPWIVLDTSFWWVTEGHQGTPWNHWMPGTAEHSGWNRITLYRRIREQGNIYFQLLRGWVTFFEGGDNSPAKQGQLLVSMSRSTVDSIQANQFLDASTFRQASDLFFNAAWWLNSVGEPTLKSLASQVDHGGSGFEGSAADAFAWAMEDMAIGMRALSMNITSPTDWPTDLDNNAAAVDAFKAAMSAAWHAFVAYRYYDPNWLVQEVLQSMERQVDDTGVRSADVWSAASTEMGAAWWFDFSAQGLGRYNLMSLEGWVGLNNDMKATWVSHMTQLDLSSRNATQALITSFNSTWRSMQRGVLALPHMPYPGTANPADPFSGGIESELPELPTSVGGGANSNFDPSQVGGGGSESGGGFDPSQVGGGGGASSNFDPSQVGGGGGGGLNLDPSQVGGEGGGAGFNLDPSQTGGGVGGGSGGGFTGGGLIPGLGAVGGGLGGGRPGTGGKEDNVGGGHLPGPSPLNPGTVGGSLNPGHGVVLGPLGTPPPGYAGAGPMTGIPGGGGAGNSVLASGGYGLQNLPGAAKIAASPTAGGLGSGMPFMPPMGGMGGAGTGDEKERERNTWLAEEEDTWGTDPDCAPAVVGRDDAEHTEYTRPSAPTSPSRNPGAPGESGRGRTTHRTS